MLFLHLSDVYGVRYDYIAEDFSYADVTINRDKPNEETHTVELLYNYDEKVLEKLQGFINNFPEDKEYFYVKDLELINFLVNNLENSNFDNLDPYSGELKSYINNSNIEYYVDNRAGGGNAFSTERFGIAIFRYEDIIYYVDPYLGTKAEYIIYVPNETKNTKEDLIAAAQERIDKYLEEEGIATISYNGTAYEVWAREIYNVKIMSGEIDANMTFEEFFLRKDEYIEEQTEGNYYEIEGLNAADDTFLITIKIGDKEKSFNIIIRRDSSKMVTPTYASADINTDVEINSSSSSIPLDTSIQVEKITRGNEYERIIKILGLEENEMFDLKLYSNSLENYITKLLNGEFEVKIPISKELKGKNLIVYYVDEKGNVKEYDVTIKDGFATFITDHFSIYTLAEKSTTSDDKDIIGDNNNNETNDDVDNTVANENLPNAGITKTAVIAIIALIAILGLARFKMKQYNDI